MSSHVELLDVVVLVQDSQTEQVVLRRGEMGTVVEMLAPDVYEVEFCDEFGRAYAFASLHANQLLVLHNQGKKWGQTTTPLQLAA
ncbi:MAG: DUF4926 domain-containing protein [Ardenticatenaceae bacterium]